MSPSESEHRSALLLLLALLVRLPFNFTGVAGDKLAFSFGDEDDEVADADELPGGLALFSCCCCCCFFLDLPSEIKNASYV